MMDPKVILKQVFGFSDFRPGQEEVIKLILNKKNVLAVLSTGAGKSLCYQLPALLFSGRTIVVSPLIALMNDQTAHLNSLKIPADKLHSHCNYAQKQNTLKAFIKGETKILYMSPEKLMNKQTLSQFKELPIDMFVIDEAHCISKWGAGFRPEYEQLSQLKDLFPKAVLAGFTATADSATRLDIVRKLTHNRSQIIVKGFGRPNLFLSVEPKKNWKKRLIEFLDQRRGLSGILYVLSRKETELLADFLKAKGFFCIPYHAGQTAQTRREAQDTFMTENGVIMSATTAFGMGIDKPDIRFVVHVNLPSSMEDFYQEIGRAGRDGQRADTLLFYGLNDLITRRKMIQSGEESLDYKLRANKRLDSLLAYSESSSCRKKSLLSYFGEDFEKCNLCDNCFSPPKLVQGTIPAQIFLSAMYRTGQCFGMVHIIDIVRGVLSPKVKNRGHHKLPTFKKGMDHSKNFWEILARQLVSSGHIHVDIENFGALKITKSGEDVLYGRKDFLYKEISIPQPRLKQDKLKSQPDRLRPAIPVSEKPEDIKLLLKLKKHRLKLAREKNSPAFIVFSDRTLNEMTYLKPKNLKEMSQVNGVGPQKLSLYGESFLKIIQQHRSI